MKVIVTGATGFVGRALTAEFESRGIETIAVGGPNSASAAYSIDVGDGAQVRTLEVEKDVDAVIHAAGITHRFGRVSEAEFRRVNVAGVENVANVAAPIGAKHFLLLSSTLVYGRRKDTVPIAENNECHPFDIYGKSKLDGESAARKVCEAAGLDLTIFRPAPIMGEGSKGNFARLIRAIDRGRFIWVGKGDNLKSVVYVGDVARAAAAVLLKNRKGTEIFNIASDPVRMKDIVDTIAQRLGRKVPSLHLPPGPIQLASRMSGKLSRMLDTWLGDDVYSNKKLQDAYGFTPDTPLDEAVGREVEYYLKHK